MDLFVCVDTYKITVNQDMECDTEYSSGNHRVH